MRLRQMSAAYSAGVRTSSTIVPGVYWAAEKALAVVPSYTLRGIMTLSEMIDLRSAHGLQDPTRGGHGDGLTTRQVFMESVRAREHAALADLGAVAGGRSLCSLSRHGTAVPAVKYHEGAAAALAEVRRAVEALADDHDGGRSARVVLLNVRARWRTQSRTVGRMGPDWTGYLTGGLDALDQMSDDDGGLDALDVRD